MTTSATLHPLDISESTATAPIHILGEAWSLFEAAQTHRRWLHAHPELSFQEVHTAAYLVHTLRSYGISEIFEGVGRTGVVAIIRGGNHSDNNNGEGPCIALRADMDGLPLQETAEIAYRSVNENCMHACGHDGHMTGLLLAAKILQDTRDQLRGVVKLVFQPAEEGYGGAREMIKDGVLEDKLGPRVDEIYGIHLWSYDSLGNIGCQVGPVMAASDKFTLRVKGKGGHGAAPHGTVDAIVEAAHLVTALQTVISRNKDPLEGGVLTCGMIRGGTGYNIIADEVSITGTCRSFTKDTQELIKQRMHSVCCGIASTFGGEIDMDYCYGYPPTINAYPECNQVVVDAAKTFVGSERAQKPQKTMGAEDFSFFLEQRPGCFLFVGAALPGPQRPHHKSVFDFDERAMLISTSIFVQIVRNKLGVQSA